MSLQLESLKGIPISFATCSIGCKPGDKLQKKINAISAAGFKAIELAFPDIQQVANDHLRKEVQADDYDDLCTAARVIKAWLDAKGMKVMMLQPFVNFEGWPEDSQERKDVFSRAKGWVEIMKACGTDLLQVGASDTPSEKIGTDRNRFVRDLQELCDLLKEHNFRLAYENWCWSHAPDWKDVWDIVQKVDRPNIGLCLDTFHSAGGEWGDPTTKSGLVADQQLDELNEKWLRSCEKLSRTIPADKLYLLQISDAYKPRHPFSKDVDERGFRPRRRWSADFRPLPYSGGYLPVTDFAKAVLKTGFRGWFSYEPFDSGPEGSGKEYDLEDYAKSAIKCHEYLLQDCVGQLHTKPQLG